MGKRKPSSDRPPATPTSYRPAADVADALEKFRASFAEYPPAYSQIIDRALRMYLRSKGHKLAETPDERAN